MGDNNAASAAAAPAVAPVLVLAPGLQHDDSINKYGTATGRKLYEASVTSLCSSGETKYVGEDGSLHNFCRKGINDAGANRWHDAHTVPSDPVAHPNELTSLPVWVKYGLLAMGTIRAYVLTYIATAPRVAQVSMAMYMCLFASLIVKAQNHIFVWAEDYTLKGLKSGALFLKGIIRESHADTNSTTLKIREKLMNMETQFAELNFNVTKLNSHVKIWMQQLQAHRENTRDLLAKLLGTYKTSPDSEIVDYVKRKTRDWDEGDNRTTDRLMYVVGNMYVTRSGEDFEGGRNDQVTFIELEAKALTLTTDMQQKGRIPKAGDSN